MPIGPAPVVVVPPVTGLDIVSNALMEIGALAQGQHVETGDANFGLSKLNRLLDQWNARRLFVPNLTFPSFNLQANHQPHTIGPQNADFSVTQRPVKILGASIVMNGISVPLEIQDDEWYANLRMPNLNSSIPTDLFYSPTSPNGSIYLWPISTTVYALELVVWGLLTKVKLADPMVLPPGYEDAITLTLAEKLCPAFGKTPDPALTVDAMRARAIVQSNNSAAPRISLQDSGLGGSGGFFNYKTGLTR